MKADLVFVIAVVSAVAGFEDGDLSHLLLPVTTHGAKYQIGNPDLNVYGNDQDKTTSYSISYNDYLYLQRHKTEGQDSPYNPERAPEDVSHHDPAGFPPGGRW